MALIRVDNIKDLGGYVINANDTDLTAAILAAISAPPVSSNVPFIPIVDIKNAGGYVIDTSDPAFVAAVQALITSGPNWGAVYEVDFTTLPNQDMSAIGAHTVDGMTWYSKGAVDFGGDGANAIVNGSGMRTAGCAWGIAGTLAPFQTAWFPFLQIPDFDVTYPFLVAFRFTGPLSTTNYYVAGVSSLADDGVAVLVGERAVQDQIRADMDSGGTVMAHVVSSVGPINPVTMVPGSPTTGDHLYFSGPVHLLTAGCFHAPWTGSFPLNLYAITNAQNPVINNNVLTNPGFSICRNRTSAFASFLTHMAVLQPIFP